MLLVKANIQLNMVLVTLLLNTRLHKFALGGKSLSISSRGINMEGNIHDLIVSSDANLSDAQYIARDSF